MSDARWFEIEEDVAAAREHFNRSVALFAAGGFAGDSLDSYRARMALLHAMQSGHTALEAALVRILNLLREETPAGSDRQADLIRRVARMVADRPPILPADLAKAADETRRFRHIAMKSYGAFEPDRAASAVQAAELLAQGLPAAIDSLRQRLDP